MNNVKPSLLLAWKAREPYQHPIHPANCKFLEPFLQINNKPLISTSKNKESSSFKNRIREARFISQWENTEQLGTCKTSKEFWSPHQRRSKWTIGPSRRVQWGANIMHGSCQLALTKNVSLSSENYRPAMHAWSLIMHYHKTLLFPDLSFLSQLFQETIIVLTS